MKIMKFSEFQKKSRTNHEILGIPRENHENHQNHGIPCEKHENYKN